MRRAVVVAVVAAAQLACVGAAVAPQLSGRLAGDDYRMAVQPVDPIDPFRGAFVALDYPGLAPLDQRAGDPGEVFVSLEESDGLWVASGVSPSRPAEGPYLACRTRAGSTDCGIGSWFTSQERAVELEESLAAGGGVATVRIDDRGNASVVDVR